MKSSKPILQEENNAADSMRVQRALHQHRTINASRIASKGKKALEFLMGPRNDKSCFILWYVTMPGMGGEEFVRHGKSRKRTRPIPVIVQTGFTADKDWTESFNLGVAGCMTKPAYYRQFVETMRTIDLYRTSSKFPGGGQTDGI